MIHSKKLLLSNTFQIIVDKHTQSKRKQQVAFREERITRAIVN